jgi:hypothetical protein
VVDKSNPNPRLYIVVPSDLYFTYKHQPYHTEDGKLLNGHVGDVGKVEQWALLIPTGGEKPPTSKDEENHAGGTKMKAD